MKFVYVIPVLAVSAAFGATSASPGREHARPPQPQVALATPPWLSEPSGPWQIDEADEADPHATAAVDVATPTGTCTYDPGMASECESCAEAEGDPHAGVYTGDQDPHTGLHAGDEDPHAGLYAGDEDPHAGMYAGDDPHAGLELDAADPHAVVPALGLAEAATAPAPVERSRAANGKSVAEVFATRSALAERPVTVRGTIVKLTEGVLGKTYLHLRDGTGTTENGDDDLTVTTTEAFSLGETVELEGRLAIDQDVGVGYSYPALLADAARVQR